MCVCKNVLVILGLIFLLNLVQCTEFVPVYMWSTNRIAEKVPALHKISQDSFRDDILELIKDTDLVLVFAEETLSPEDFAQHDQSGRAVFSNLAKLRKTLKVSYIPYVQNPIRALKHLDATVSEISIAELSGKFEIPKTDILIVDLNDARDMENRVDMLKRHDAVIHSVFKEIEKSDKNVIVLYSAHHESWVASENIGSRKARSLLATNERATSSFFNDTHAYLYLSQALYYKSADAASPVNVTFTYTSSSPTAEIILVNLKSVATAPQLEVALNFTNATSAGYWVLNEIKASLTDGADVTEYILTSGAPIYAPYAFSFHCGDQVFSNSNFTLKISDFQVQVFFEQTANVSSQRFSDAYDCVGFTSVPIWSGIFVTTILLIIMTIGITMMMDIRTMDRFDDAKGKTITINAE